jgi:hypothetical protein
MPTKASVDTLVILTSQYHLPLDTAKDESHRPPD